MELALGRPRGWRRNPINRRDDVDLRISTISLARRDGSRLRFRCDLASRPRHAAPLAAGIGRRANTTFCHAALGQPLWRSGALAIPIKQLVHVSLIHQLLE